MWIDRAFANVIRVMLICWSVISSVSLHEQSPKTTNATNCRVKNTAVKWKWSRAVVPRTSDGRSTEFANFCLPTGIHSFNSFNNNYVPFFTFFSPNKKSSTHLPRITFLSPGRLRVEQKLINLFFLIHFHFFYYYFPKSDGSPSFFIFYFILLIKKMYPCVSNSSQFSYPSHWNVNKHSPLRKRFWILIVWACVTNRCKSVAKVGCLFEWFLFNCFFSQPKSKRETKKLTTYFVFCLIRESASSSHWNESMNLTSLTVGNFAKGNI